ncbi:MAG TPA: 4-(cytidine 5'-diphospho)-2-C-methyl-D-erythritol kinase [Rhizomicrobium sp.]|nr:4-(cytidine 5'-diphospho)-2-C-methyl-D-erythritol kinase [Rhizomicrobium sp.]
MAATVFAPAKINLTLHVGARRADGYHELESLVAFADVGDELHLSEAGGLALDVKGPFAGALAREKDNLVLRAARALAAHAGIASGARMTLTKNLPVASGLGGGSADAAAALRGLAKLWNLDITGAVLAEIAYGLGADVPACLAGVPVHMEGIGERLTQIADLPPLDLLLVNPGVEVSTEEVFARLDRRSGTGRKLPHFPTKDSLIGYLDRSYNDLEKPAGEIAPIIREAIATICDHETALVTRMSGSGATCFGIFDNADTASHVAGKIAAAHPGWWVRVAKTLQS